MSDTAIMQLLRAAPFSFVGTIEHLGAATMTDVPIDERTAVVRVDQVLHAPPAFKGLTGHRITMRLLSDKEPPAVGSTQTFFVQGLAFGESIAVAEVGRLPLDVVQPRLTAAMEAGQPAPFAALQSQIDTENLYEHFSSADAVVVGRVIKLESAMVPTFSEHDPDWWKALLEVYHVEKGNVPGGELAILYPNSLDVRWRNCPKPKASQQGVWMLHATEGDLRQLALFEILHAEDFQPTQILDALREIGG